MVPLKKSLKITLFFIIILLINFSSCKKISNKNLLGNLSLSCDLYGNLYPESILHINKNLIFVKCRIFKSYWKNKIYFEEHRDIIILFDLKSSYQLFFTDITQPFDLICSGTILNNDYFVIQTSDQQYYLYKYHNHTLTKHNNNLFLQYLLIKTYISQEKAKKHKSYIKAISPPKYVNSFSYNIYDCTKINKNEFYCVAALAKKGIYDYTRSILFYNKNKILKEIDLGKINYSFTYEYIELVSKTNFFISGYWKNRTQFFSDKNFFEGFLLQVINDKARKIKLKINSDNYNIYDMIYTNNNLYLLVYDLQNKKCIILINPYKKI